jgi:hypothetical protein
MGLFGPSKTDLEERINELEDKLEDAEDRARDAERQAERAYDRAGKAMGNAKEAARRAREAKDDAKENAHTAFELARALDGVDASGAKPFRRKREDEVAELDKARIAWKATRNHIAKLLLPEDTTVVFPRNGNKCRADQAIVLGFYNVNMKAEYGHSGTKRTKYAADKIAFETTDFSLHNQNFEYGVGERVTPDNGELNTDTSRECETGIHFFRTEDEALDWYKP